MHDLLSRVKQQIEGRGLALAEAATEIGVTKSTLERHLAGAYVRSDSQAKYRLWLEGKSEPRVNQQLRLLEEEAHVRREDSLAGVSLGNSCRPGVPHAVVDLFSGCGGMSLGFDVLDGGGVFETVMALDNEEPMVRVFNENHPGSAAREAGQVVDLSDFFNEAEVLAYYLDHLAGYREDDVLRESLNDLPRGGLRALVSRICALDQQFLGELDRIRATNAFVDAYGALGRNVTGQTSVIGFHKALKLPPTSRARPSLEAILWSCDGGASEREPDLDAGVDTEISEGLSGLWEAELSALRSRAGGNGRGQLSSSARRIRSFLDVLETPPMLEVREAWEQWRERRDTQRVEYFSDETVWAGLKELYVGERRVSVLLGGPPCQGFSRIGRGKIRSLREQSVHVQYDPEAGDHRNRLMHQYVLFVGALAPDVFLFENVRHFQAEVKTPEGVFRATDILSEAIRLLSHEHVDYEVSSRIVDASEHLVPQTRERFFMAGVRSDLAPKADVDLPRWTLALPVGTPVALSAALVGLPEPSGPRETAEGLADTVEVTGGFGGGDESVKAYQRWVRQSSRREGSPPASVDAHHARVPRADDEAFFGLMGPGRRWMDYRCDESETLGELQHVVEALTKALSAMGQGNGTEHPALQILSALRDSDVAALGKKLDGSLSLRLLLESIPPQPGALRHHLAKSSYLAKRDGNHGDWLSRMDPNRPSKTMVSHMAKDTYAYVHPTKARTISVREAARVQTFPDWYRFGCLGLVDAFRVIGNAVPPLLGYQMAARVAQILSLEPATEGQVDDEPDSLAREREILADA